MMPKFCAFHNNLNCSICETFVATGKLSEEKAWQQDTPTPLEPEACFYRGISELETMITSIAAQRSLVLKYSSMLLDNSPRSITVGIMEEAAKVFASSVKLEQALVDLVSTALIARRQWQKKEQEKSTGETISMYTRQHLG